MTKEISDLRSIATAMTLAETNRKEILEEWEKLQVIVQLAEKEFCEGVCTSHGRRALENSHA